ncbi:MAG: MraY family glycosyltransferase [Acidobacteriota bacterium]
MRLLILLVAALLAAGLAPIMRRLAIALGAQDDPGDARKVHLATMPRLGGIAILAGTLIAVATGVALGAPGAARILEFPRPILGLAAAAIVVAIFGLIDDVYDLAPGWNLAAQILAAAIAWEAGFRWERIEIGVHSFDLGSAALPFTVLFFLTVMNALNLVDGLDGLAAALSLIALLVLLTQAVIGGGPVASIVGLALAGGIAGFLVENLHPARQFMGTCGSQLIGLLLASLAVGTLRGRVGVNPAIPLLAFGIPLLDMTMAILRRVSRGASPLRGDREHLHHRLLDRGLTQGRAVLTLALLQGLFASLALIALLVPERWSLIPIVPGLLLAITIGWVIGRPSLPGRPGAAP